MSTLRKHRLMSPLVGFTAAILLVLLAAGIGQAAGLFDTPPSREQIEKDARERGIEGPLHVSGPVEDHVLSPERHGPYLFVPLGWQAGHEPLVPIGTPPAGKPSQDTAEVTSAALWRPASAPNRPDAPQGVRLKNAWSEALPLDVRGQYVDQEGHNVFSTVIYRPLTRPIRVDVWTDNGIRLFEYTQIDGRSAVVWRTPADGKGEIGARAFDEQSGIEYAVQISGTRKLTQADAIEILRSLMP